MTGTSVSRLVGVFRSAWFGVRFSRVWASEYVSQCSAVFLVNMC